MINSSEERTYRAALSALKSSGRGILYLTVWNVIKTVLNFQYSSELEEVRTIVAEGTAAERILYILTGAVLLGIYTFIYFRIGFQAISEGKGEHQGGRYPAAVVLLAAVHLAEILMIVSSLITKTGNFMTLSQLPVELISLAALTDLFVNAVKVRRYDRRNGIGKG